MNYEMNQRRLESFLLSSNRPEWENAESARLFCNFKVSSLLPSVDIDSFNESQFGRLPNDKTSYPYNSREIFVKYLSAEFGDQSKPVQSRKHVSDTPTVERRGGARRLSLRSAKVALSDIYATSISRSNVEDMMRTGRVDHMPGTEPAIDIPLASTSGRVCGEFWNERRRCHKSFEYQSLGTTLYHPHGDADVRNYWELPQAKSLEENVKIDKNHSVSTGFQRGKQVDERSIWLSSSHKLGVNHVLATQFANDLKGGNNFYVNTTHDLVQDSTLSTNLYTNSLGDCSLEVELQREKKRGNQEVLESIMTNVRTGETLLKLQSRNILKDIVFLNSIMSNLRGQHALRFMTTIPLWRSGFVSSSLGTDLRGSQKFCLNAIQKIHDQIMIGASFTTNLKQEDSISFEAKHQLDGMGNLVVKVAKVREALKQWDITTSLTTERNSWLCTYRNSSSEGRTSGLEWRYEVCPDQFLSIRAASEDGTCTLSTEMCLPC